MMISQKTPTDFVGSLVMRWEGMGGGLPFIEDLENTSVGKAGKKCILDLNRREENKEHSRTHSDMSKK